MTEYLIMRMKNLKIGMEAHDERISQNNERIRENDTNSSLVEFLQKENQYYSMEKRTLMKEFNRLCKNK